MRTIIRENSSNNSFIEQRRAKVEEITRKHSEKLFGYSHATIGEIRKEAIRQKLELLFNK